MAFGARRSGTDLAPEIITRIWRDSPRRHDAEITRIRVSGYGSVPAGDDPCLPYGEEIARICAELRDQVINAISAGELPLIIGGDHSLSWGSIAGALAVNPGLHCVYMDAHGDINTPECSPSHNVHGMHMSGICGISENFMSRCIQRNAVLDTGRLLYIGVRSLDHGEKDIIAEKGIDVTKDSDKFIVPEGPLHFSFDIDSFDPSVAPATGVPEAEGFSKSEGMRFIKRILTEGDVRSMDFVEFNPLLDTPDQRTLRLVGDILDLVDAALD